MRPVQQCPIVTYGEGCVRRNGYPGVFRVVGGFLRRPFIECPGRLQDRVGGLLSSRSTGAPFLFAVIKPFCKCRPPYPDPGSDLDRREFVPQWFLPDGAVGYAEKPCNLLKRQEIVFLGLFWLGKGRMGFQRTMVGSFGFLSIEVSSGQCSQALNLPLKLPFDVPQASAICDRLFRHDELTSVHEPAVFMLVNADCGINIIEEVGGSTKSPLP